MSENKWKPTELMLKGFERLDEAVANLCEREGKKYNGVTQYGAYEHLALLRYVIDECCEKREVVRKVAKLDKDKKPLLENGKPVLEDQKVTEYILDREKLRKELNENANFYALSSNAKKMWVGHGELPKEAEKPTRGYE